MKDEFNENFYKSMKMSMRSKLLYEKYQTYQYYSGSSYFTRKTIITMRLTVSIVNGKKHYNWERARTFVVVRDKRNNNHVSWKYSYNNLLNIKCGDDLEHE